VLCKSFTDKFVEVEIMKELNDEDLQPIRGIKSLFPEIKKFLFEIWLPYFKEAGLKSLV